MNARPDIADIAATMRRIGVEARAAASVVAEAPAEQRTAALREAAKALRAHAKNILAANAQDLSTAHDLTPALRDRLMLDETRVAAIADAVETIAAIPDPVGTIIAAWTQPNGLKFERVRVPIGVIGIIYESRPNVTADAGALALRAGNVAILRGGTESALSSRAIHAAMVEGLGKAGLPAAAIALVPTTDRQAVGLMLAGLDGAIDVIVPRGGKSLVARVQAEARVPVLGHLEGICHTYVHADADLAKARAIVLNAKMRRTGVCGATETLLVDRAVLATHLKPILDDLIAAGCEIRGDDEIAARDSRVKPASDADWHTEYLEAILSVKCVGGIDEAIAHIATYGTQHTDAIVTENKEAAEHFLKRVDSAIVLHNASTQFADGGEFGFGAEIGIATGKLHARGPVGAEQLTTFKYVVRGSGQVRP